MQHEVTAKLLQLSKTAVEWKYGEAENNKKNIWETWEKLSSTSTSKLYLRKCTLVIYMLDFSAVLITTCFILRCVGYFLCDAVVAVVNVLWLTGKHANIYLQQTLLSKASYSNSYIHSYTDGGGCYPRCRPAHQEQFHVQHLAQEHFDMQTRGFEPTTFW